MFLSTFLCFWLKNVLQKRSKQSSGQDPTNSKTNNLMRKCSRTSKHKSWIRWNWRWAETDILKLNFISVISVGIQILFLKMPGKISREKKRLRNPISHTYLFLHSVILIDGILVFWSAYSQNRCNLFSKEITHWKQTEVDKWLIYTRQLLNRVSL